MRLIMNWYIIIIENYILFYISKIQQNETNNTLLLSDQRWKGWMNIVAEEKTMETMKQLVMMIGGNIASQIKINITYCLISIT